MILFAINLSIILLFGKIVAQTMGFILISSPYTCDLTVKDQAKLPVHLLSTESTRKTSLKMPGEAIQRKSIGLPRPPRHPPPPLPRQQTQRRPQPQQTHRGTGPGTFEI